MRRVAGASAKIRVSEVHWGKKVSAEVEGKEVSRVFIGSHQVRVGPAGEVRMAGIGGVGTQREFRRRGLMRQVYARVMAEVTKDGYPCSGLFTGTNIVAHRLYRQHGYVDITVHRYATKLLDHKAVIVNVLSGAAASEEFRAWRGAITVTLRGYSPVCLRLGVGKLAALARAPRRVDLSLTLSAATLAFLSWGRLTAEYAEAAKLLTWEGEREVWERLVRALGRTRPCVHAE